MSYRILNWKTRKLEQLVIPASIIEEWDGGDWMTVEYGRATSKGEQEVTVEFDEDSRIQGTLVVGDGQVAIHDIHLRGEGSGSSLEDVVIPALKKSRGELRARIVWEDGEASELVALDGEITETALD